MPIPSPYRCNNCGERFTIDILTPEERRDAERERRPIYSVACPKCRRQDVRKGWE